MAIANQQANGQGCVAIKGIGGICNRPAEGGSWYLDLNNRYFKSYKHFVGKEEQHEREEEGTNVINYSFETDITVTRVFNSRLSMGVTMPILAFTRSSLYEHDGRTRHSTRSFGIGDIRIVSLSLDVRSQNFT